MRCLFLAGVLSLLTLNSSVAQEFRASISGVVTDPAGSLIAGANITVTEINTGTKQETKTDGAGHYIVPLLLPGDYDVSVKVPGFKEFIRKGLRLGAGETPAVDVKLEVGATVQTIEVTEAVPL